MVKMYISSHSDSPTLVLVSLGCYFDVCSSREDAFLL